MLIKYLCTSHNTRSPSNSIKSLPGFIEYIKQNRFINNALFITLIILGSRFIYIATALMWNRTNQDSKSIFTLLNQWDAGWYGSIIEHGYVTEPIISSWETPVPDWTFFPLYPLVIRYFNLITGIKIEIAGVLVSTLFLAVALYFVINYLEMTRKSPSSIIAPILLAFGPYSFYFSSLYTESLYIMLIAICFYYLEKENWIICGAFGALLSASRPTGVLILFPVLIKIFLIYRKQGIPLKSILSSWLKENEKLLSLMLIPVGLFAYMTFLYFHTGDPLAFSRAQIGWGRENMNPIIVLYNSFSWNKYLSSWALLGLVISFYLIRVKRYTEGVFAFLSIIIPLSSSVISIPRFFIGSLVLVYGLADIILQYFPNMKWIVIILICQFSVILLWAWYSSDGLLI